MKLEHNFAESLGNSRLHNTTNAVQCSRLNVGETGETMPLISQQPDSCELPDLLLAGTCSFADFFADGQWSTLGETWKRFFDCQQDIENRNNSDRSFGLELYPSTFSKDRHWYYMACTEVTSLEQPFPSSVISKFIPASKYVKFTVSGPVAEIAPAFRYIYDEWLPNSNVQISAGYDLELYDSRFCGPSSEESFVDLLLPVTD